MPKKKKTVVVFHKHGPRPKEQWHKLGTVQATPTKAQRTDYRRLRQQQDDELVVIPAGGLPAHVLLGQEEVGGG